jgi:hypothetical protein
VAPSTGEDSVGDLHWFAALLLGSGEVRASGTDRGQETLGSQQDCRGFARVGNDGITWGLKATTLYTKGEVALRELTSGTLPRHLLPLMQRRPTSSLSCCVMLQVQPWTGGGD